MAQRIFIGDTFCATEASSADLPFYASMLRDPEWIAGTGYSLDDFLTDEQIIQFYTPKCEGDLDLVLSIKETGEKIAFCHHRHKNNEDFEFSGGVIKQYQNSILVVSLYVFVLDIIFRLRPQTHVLGAVYEKNTRSLKLDKGLGYQIIGQRHYDVRLFNVVLLTKEKFYESPITQRLLD